MRHGNAGSCRGRLPRVRWDRRSSCRSFRLPTATGCVSRRHVSRISRANSYPWAGRLAPTPEVAARAIWRALDVFGPDGKEGRRRLFARSQRLCGKMHLTARAEAARISSRALLLPGTEEELLTACGQKWAHSTEQRLKRPPAMHIITDSVPRTHCQMTAEQLLLLGKRQVVYLKSGIRGGELVFMLYGADGALSSWHSTPSRKRWRRSTRTVSVSLRSIECVMAALKSYSCKCGCRFRASDCEDTTKCLTCRIIDDLKAGRLPLPATIRLPIDSPPIVVGAGHV